MTEKEIEDISVAYCEMVGIDPYKTVLDGDSFYCEAWIIEAEYLRKKLTWEQAERHVKHMNT